MRKGCTVFLLLTSLVISFNTLFAQGTGPAPCGDADDPNYDPNMCPLDTWVFVLAAIVLAYAVWHIYRKQKLYSNSI